MKTTQRSLSTLLLLALPLTAACGSKSLHEVTDRATNSPYSASASSFKAARVDGAGFFRIFWSVMLPMATPMLVVAVILQVTGVWNDFILGLVFAGRENLPMTVQLNNIVNSTQGERAYNVDMAATILTALVPLAVYFGSGRWFVRGIAAGAVKG